MCFVYMVRVHFATVYICLHTRPVLWSYCSVHSDSTNANSCSVTFVLHKRYDNYYSDYWGKNVVAIYQKYQFVIITNLVKNYVETWFLLFLSFKKLRKLWKKNYGCCKQELYYPNGEIVLQNRNYIMVNTVSSKNTLENANFVKMLLPLSLGWSPIVAIELSISDSALQSDSVALERPEPSIACWLEWWTLWLPCIPTQPCKHIHSRIHRRNFIYLFIYLFIDQ